MPKISLRFAFAAAAIALAVSGVPPSAQAQDNSRVRVVVAYKAGASTAVRAQVARLGGRVIFDLGAANAVAVSVPRSAVSALQVLAGVDFVEYAVPRYPMGMRSSVRAGAVSPLAGSQVVPYGIPLVQADQLPLPGPGSVKKKICIIDSGVDALHEDLALNNMAGQNYTSSGTWDTDENSHGTHVTGTVAALNNLVGVVGVAPNKELNLFISKIFEATGGASSITVSAGMLGCLLSRSNVVSMSLGGDRASRIEERIVDLMASRGILLIAAAGNAGTTNISYPAGFASVMSVAAVDANMAWAAFSQFNADVEISGPGVDVLSTVPAFSQTGATLDVGASSYDVEGMDESPRASATGPLADFGLGDTPVPGSMTGQICLISRGTISFADKVLNCQASGGIGAIIYNNTAGPLFGTMGGVVTAIPSVGALQADGMTMLGQVGQSTTVSVFGSPDLYASYSGTSMATPHVSAVAALVWSHFPLCTAQQIRASLNLSALDIGDPGRDDKTGEGLVQAKAAYDRIFALGCGN